MASNTNIQLADLDFSTLKSNFITYLQGQNVLKDYDYSGSALSNLLDVLTYNTQYNAYYLNMVANEMFLDSAIQRSSVVSHAKTLGYTPRSAIAPTAKINMNVYSVAASSLTLPQYTRFISEAIDGVNYTFLTTDSMTVNTNTTSQIATFMDVELKQGIYNTNAFTVDLTANPTLTYEIPDEGIDTSSLLVTVQESATNTSIDTYTLADDYTALNSSSLVYFLQEDTKGFFQIYFGDNILGKKLSDGNIINVSYISTKGKAGEGANSFTLLDSIGSVGAIIVNPTLPALSGKDKESIDSIKFQAPKAYATQKRAVTKDDYITIIQQNQYGIALDAVNVWGGEETTPPQFGKILISVKPSGGYSLSEAQKNILINDVIKPYSMMTITPELISPDYIFLLLTSNVQFDAKKTTLTSVQIQDLVKKGVIDYCNSTLNTFNSTFNVANLILYIQSLNKSIVGVDFDVTLQRRILPQLINGKDYNLEYNNPLKRATNQSITFPISFSQYDVNANYYPIVYFEERNDSSTSLSEIILLNGGSNYTNPTVTIYGDGTGAKAYATTINGIVSGIVITDVGSNYTQALVAITDSTGTGAAATATLKENYSKLRSYYFNNSIKNILVQDAGSVDFDKGIVSLTNFQPYSINSSDGYYRVNALAAERFVSSSFNKILTLDSSDVTSVIVNVTAK